MVLNSSHRRSRILELLCQLYGSSADELFARIEELVDRSQDLRTREHDTLWDERSVVLITYGDQVRCDGKSSLAAQQQFLIENGLDKLISAVHILPFFPYSSDDGFSVIDYRRVDDNVGDWTDVDRLGQSFDLMFDFVVNHCSQENEWFRRFLAREEPYANFFVEADPTADLSAVTRPRSTPLLTPFESADGERHVWTTFSADQVDLNFACPDVLIEMLEILLLYIQHGATIIRLDAIGFLWKTIGTTCMHLPETHAVVKLMREVVDEVAAGTILLTETNVPHDENVSYFGDGDEAHMVYQFSLAPLLLDAFLTGDAEPLNHWLSELEYPGAGMTYFNFTASHDGIGVRPLEGLVSQERVDGLVESVRERGGRVNMRVKPDGTESPYELNITYFSALDSPEGLPPKLHARKFLTSQGIVLALRGIPGIYFHSLVATPNYNEGVEQTGQNRTINRRKFKTEELQQILSENDSVQRFVFDGYREMLDVRIHQPAFHPDAEQTFVETEHPSLIAFVRTSCDESQRILVLANIGSDAVEINLSRMTDLNWRTNLLDGKTIAGAVYRIEPFGIAWIEAAKEE